MSAFNYNISVTGDCTNTGSGIISLYLYGGTPPYTAEWISPYLPPDDVVVDEPTLKTGLYSNVYGVRVNDSTLPINSEFYINIPVSNGVCISVNSVQSTTCGLDNGSVTGSSTSMNSSTTYYLYTTDNIFVKSATTNNGTIVFADLSGGTYYLDGRDYGGCTGQSQSFIIENSQDFDFGLWTVPNSSCGGTPIGKVVVTGATGTSPYTYFWSNGQTTSAITGLTAGVYSVTVTDYYGCMKSQTATVVDVSPIGFGLFTATPPTCFASDGVLSLTITGGTAPYYYSASSGNVLVSYSTTFTVSGLSAGQYNFVVTDAGLCQLQVGTSLVAPQGITSVSMQGQNSTCSSVDGQISVSVVGGTVPYTYTLIYPNSNQVNVTNSQTTHIFTGLDSGTYTVAVSDNSGCSTIQEITLVTENKFTIALTGTTTSCNQKNGTIVVQTTTGYTLPLDYSVDGLNNIIDTNLTGVTFTNIAGGTHNVVVTDATGCSQSSNVFVPYSQPLNFSLYSTSCGSGSDGSITAFINSGTAPYTFNWSSNVPGNPQQIQLTGLTAGTYSLSIIDSTSCVLSRSTTINCNSNYVSYQTYVMGEEIFQLESPTKNGLLQMLNEGFYDLTTGNTSCSLVSADFVAQVSVTPSGWTTSDTFFTSTSLVQAPSDNLWYDTIKTLLLAVPGVGNVIVDPLSNQITISTDPANTSLDGQQMVIDLIINYDITCLS